MLERLLSSIAEGGLHSYDGLAQELGVPRPLLEVMIEDLARRGYLRAAGGACDGCAGCGMASGPCGRLWTLTGKGIRDSLRSGIGD